MRVKTRSKSHHASSFLLQEFYRYYQEKRQSDSALGEERKIRLMKNSRNLLVLDSVQLRITWKTCVVGNIFGSVLGDNSESGSEEAHKNPSLLAVFKKVLH